MSFFVSQKTLERLEWNRILAMLGEHARTPGVRARCVAEPPETQPDPAALFEASRHGVADRLSETREARAILVSGDLPPIGGTVAVDMSLCRARKDGVLAARDLLGLATTLTAISSGVWDPISIPIGAYRS